MVLSGSIRVFESIYELRLGGNIIVLNQAWKMCCSVWCFVSNYKYLVLRTVQESVHSRRISKLVCFTSAVLLEAMYGKMNLNAGVLGVLFRVKGLF